MSLSATASPLPIAAGNQPLMQQKIWSWIKWASLTLSMGSILVAIVLMWFAGPAEVETVAKSVERPKTEVESPVIVERKDGEIVWQLRADEATQQLDGKMHLIHPVLTLCTQQGREVIINSEQAWLEPIQRNKHFKGEVNILHEGWKMKSNSLIYNSKLDEVHVPEKFTIKGETISARGEGMRLNRINEQINVDRGIWIQDSNPQWPGVK